MRDDDIYFEKLRQETTNTLLSVISNSVQQNAAVDKICSIIVDLKAEISSTNDIKKSIGHFVWAISTIVEALGFKEEVANNIKKLIKRDAYIVQALLLKGE